jgi:uncharacterized surface protein with fasciclin (FAS1) repeats
MVAFQQRNPTMNKHTIPLLALAGAVAAGIVFSDFVTAQELPPNPQADDIVAVASGNPDFTTLVAALRAADLVTVLQGKGPFTVFAPNNAAFAKLPPGALEDLMKPENKKKLAGILKNHVVSGKIMAADVKDGRLKMLNGDKVEVAVENGNIGFGGAKVLRGDIVASNGVIHVIDSVVMPD